MVDFNNENTVGMPAVDIERVSLLQRRYDFIEAYEHYKKQKIGGVNAQLNVMQARLISFFLQMHGMLQRRKKENSFAELQKKFFAADNENEILRLFYLLSKELDGINLTKIVSKKDYDRSIAEEENREAGL